MPKGRARNAICPRCRKRTTQVVLGKGWRKCTCGNMFHLKDAFVEVRAGWTRCHCKAVYRTTELEKNGCRACGAQLDRPET